MRIHYITPTQANNNIQSIAIPKDTTLHWNNIPKKMPKEHWTTITDKQEIEDIIIKRNKIHFN